MCSPIFRFKDCQMKIEWNVPVKIAKVNDEIIDYYLNKKLRINLLVDDNLVRTEEQIDARTKTSDDVSRSIMIVTEPEEHKRRNRCEIF